MELWQIVVLAVVQGMTEFLPISSSGHLVIIERLMSPADIESLDVAEINIVLHLGTLLSVLVYYRERIWRLLGEDRRTLWLLAIGTLPAVAVGLPLKLSNLEWLLGSPLVAGLLLPVTGLMLLWNARGERGVIEYPQMSWRQALLVGIAQAAAVFPGLSRSGSTIAAALALGLSPRSAATFSFLLAIPTIGGAGLLEIASMAGKSNPTTPIQYLLIGAIMAYGVGFAALTWLVKSLERGVLHRFAWWCIPLGILVLLLVAMNRL